MQFGHRFQNLFYNLLWHAENRTISSISTQKMDKRRLNYTPFFQHSIDLNLFFSASNSCQTKLVHSYFFPISKNTRTTSALMYVTTTTAEYISTVAIDELKNDLGSCHVPKRWRRMNFGSLVLAKHRLFQHSKKRW